MDPVTIGVLSFVAGAISAWLIKKDNKKAAMKEKVLTLPLETKWPNELSRINTKEYFFKWLNFFIERLSPPPKKLGEATPISIAPKPRALSLTIMNILNYLNRPLFWLGLIFTIWMAIDAVLPWFLPGTMLSRYSSIAAPVVAVLSPGIVGYWTNYLAIKMLFHPKKRNSLWWGLIPARRNELIEGISQGILDRLISPEIVSKYLHESALIRNLVNHSVNSIRSVVDNQEFRRETKGLIYGLVCDLVSSEETQKTVSMWVGRKIDEWTGYTWGEKIMSWFKSLWGPKVQQEVLKALPEIPYALEGVFNHIDQMLDKIPSFIEKEGGKIETGLAKLIVEGIRGLDLKRIISSQLSKMDETELENVLTGPVNKELKFIMTSGGIFGFLVGCAITWTWLRGLLLLLGLLFTAVYFATVQSYSESKESVYQVYENS